MKGIRQTITMTEIQCNFHLGLQGVNRLHHPPYQPLREGADSARDYETTSTQFKTTFFYLKIIPKPPARIHSISPHPYKHTHTAIPL